MSRRGLVDPVGVSWTQSRARGPRRGLVDPVEGSWTPSRSRGPCRGLVDPVRVAGLMLDPWI
ncbi:hypothetical protein EYF80_020704 [Liparis tanakae]|uniref:Uncharacterized protein n=1 Tax=Liparis tanakae TaxID=230148 RepID=A0A4Z2HU99_9TELE|nr:hypothetical protein EYF80_020704 [Liparis tanakae]